MSVPNVETARLAENFVRNTISIRLFGNDITLDGSTSLASLDEIAGGGYAAINLASGDWTPTIGSPSQVEHAQVQFGFTGAIDAPGTIYGYFLKDNTTGLYIGGENFSGAIVPITPVAGSTIKITPIVKVA